MNKNCFFLIGILFLSINCNKNDNIPVQSIWKANPNNPLIKINQDLNHAQWNDPCDLKKNNIYIMYLSSNLGEQGQNVLPFRATDGINWDIDVNCFA